MGLDRKTIVVAALRLLDEQGLEGVTTRRLAEVLGVAGPSLYWHVKNKDALFDHMSDAMFGEVLQTDAAVLRAPDRDERLAPRAPAASHSSQLRARRTAASVCSTSPNMASDIWSNRASLFLTCQ